MQSRLQHRFSKAAGHLLSCRETFGQDGLVVERQSFYSLSHPIWHLSHLFLHLFVQRQREKQILSWKLKAHLTKVPCNMRLDISAGDTSMKRRKEKQLPLSSPETVKTEYRMKHERLDKGKNKKCVWKRGTEMKLKTECQMKEIIPDE